jgi:cell division protein FtsQ
MKGRLTSVVVPLPGHELRPRGGPELSVRRLLRFVAAITWLCAVAAFPASAIFALQSVSVSGNAAVPAPDVLRRAGVAPGMSAFRVDTKEVRKRLLQDPRIEDAAVTMVFPRQIAIFVRERRPVAALLMEDGYLTVGSDGAAIMWVSEPGPLLPLIVAHLHSAEAQVGTVLGSQDARLGAWTAGALPADVRNQVLLLQVDDQGDVSLTLRDGVSVRLGNASSVADRLAMLPQVLDAIAARQMQVEYIDLRFTGNVIVQPVGSAQQPSADSGQGEEKPLQPMGSAPQPSTSAGSAQGQKNPVQPMRSAPQPSTSAGPGQRQKNPVQPIRFGPQPSSSAGSGQGQKNPVQPMKSAPQPSTSAGPGQRQKNPLQPIRSP